MPKYQAIFSGETHSKEVLGQRCAFVISLSFQQTENLKTNDLSMYAANMERLNSAFVNKVPILADMLNRHNASIYYPNSNAKEKALALGDNWLKTPYYQETKKLKNISSLIRWNDLLSGTHYKNVLKITKAIYKKNSEFSATVDCVCAKFVAFISEKCEKSILKKPNTIDKFTDIDYSNFKPKKAYKSCRRYILEECAITLMLRLESYTHLFHIGKVNRAVDWVAKNNISYLSNCKRDLIDKINKNPLKVTTSLKPKPCPTSTINTTPENTTKSIKSSQLIKENTYSKNGFFKNLQTNSSENSCDVFHSKKNFSERRNCYP